MPITLTPQSNPPVIGVGVSAFVQSDFIGPLPFGSYFDITFYPPAPDETPMMIMQVPTVGPLAQFVIGDKRSPGLTSDSSWSIADGALAHVSMSLHDTFGVVDTGTTDKTWSNTLGLARQIWNQPDPAGLATVQTDVSSILSELASPIETGISAIGTALSGLTIPVRIDFFAQDNLSGGATCLPLDLDLSLAAYYGLIVTITDYPEVWNFSTPDNAWSVKDFAVVRFYQGTQLLDRVGIHTISHTIAPLPGSFQPWFVRGLAEIQPTNYHVTVDWALGVCGSITGLNWPV